MAVRAVVTEKEWLTCAANFCSFLAVRGTL